MIAVSAVDFAQNLHASSRARVLSTIDWPRLLGDLAWLYGEPDAENPVPTRIDLPIYALANKLNVSRGTLRRWLEEGAEPRHSDGEMLIALWERATGKGRQYLPLAPLGLSATKARRAG